MRILMLGWEFPPFVAGGLGVACYGLTRALDRQGHRVIFVLPKPVDRVQASHVQLLTPDDVLYKKTRATSPDGPDGSSGAVLMAAEAGFQHAVIRGVSASFSSPYPAFAPPTGWFGLSNDPSVPQASVLTNDPAMRAAFPTLAVGDAIPAGQFLMPTPENPAPPPPRPMHIGTGGGAGVGYGTDLMGDAERYARLVVALASTEEFEVIHAHDWLTYPAGLALSKLSRKPLIVHVHSTEFDRAGNNVNQRVYDIERAGMQGATRVIAVSNLTKSICVRRYGVNPAKIDVVYNGIEREAEQPPEGVQIEAKDKIVLFLGRITMQKGPEYFIAAAKRVLEKFADVKFVVAGSGDMALRMIELAANMGIGHKVLFTGFLRGQDIERVYGMADCYVMPSVSEPFGIAALEAIHHDVPVIVSKTSGVAEVLTHVLKVDFWDIDEMANKIGAVLRHPPLGATLRQHGAFELRRLTWDGAAEKCVESYSAALAKK